MDCTTEPPLIQVANLTKAFGPKLAVNGISFGVRRGEVLGFLGPNGAGKSTTMRMLTGFIPPSEGSITIGGYDMLTHPLPAKRLIGYLPENAPAYSDMTVAGFLDFCAELSGLRGAARKEAVNRVVDLCFLESVLYQSVDTLSKGYLHRTCFAQAIIHDPDILVLDEPTDGLDPNQKHEIRMLIRRMGERKAIVFSTHILEEVEAVCSRAIIIDRGQIVANGTPAELKARSELNGSVLVVVRGVAGGRLAERLSSIPNTRKTAILKEANGETWARVYPKTIEGNARLLRNVLEAANGWEVQELRTEEGRLDEVFRNITLPDTVLDPGRGGDGSSPEPPSAPGSPETKSEKPVSVAVGAQPGPAPGARTVLSAASSASMPGPSLLSEVAADKTVRAPVGGGALAGHSRS